MVKLSTHGVFLPKVIITQRRKNVAEDRHFDTAVPVRIYYTETKTSTDVWKLTGNILKTPLALALDAVGVVIAGSYAVIGEIVDDSRK